MRKNYLILLSGLILFFLSCTSRRIELYIPDEILVEKKLDTSKRDLERIIKSSEYTLIHYTSVNDTECLPCSLKFNVWESLYTEMRYEGKNITPVIVIMSDFPNDIEKFYKYSGAKISTFVIKKVDEEIFNNTTILLVDSLKNIIDERVMN